LLAAKIIKKSGGDNATCSQLNAQHSPPLKLITSHEPILQEYNMRGKSFVHSKKKIELVKGSQIIN
jgi:hypothetical protein